MIRRLGQIVMAWTLVGGLATGLFLYRASDILNRSVRTDAYVERLAEDGNRSLPVFRFRDLQGRQVDAIWRAPAGAGDWHIGQRIGVLFNQVNPHLVVPDEPLILFREPGIAALATIVPLLFLLLLRLLGGRTH